MTRYRKDEWAQKKVAMFQERIVRLKRGRGDYLRKERVKHLKIVEIGTV